MELTTIWFVLIAVLWIGYFVLEGFDFGVGMLLPILDKTGGKSPEEADKRRRVMLNTIGPVWDGNEVWVLTAGGATFAAFPHWYATLFSGFYLPLLLILLALIVRNLGFEYRHKRDEPQWKARWDLAIIIGSFVPALLWGVAFANIVNGVPLEPIVAGNEAPYVEYTGTLFTLLGPIGLLGGLTTLGLFLTHGAMYIALKTEGELRQDARAFAWKSGLVTAVLAVAFLVWTNINTGSVLSWVLSVLAAVALVGGLLAVRVGREGWAFTGTFVTIAVAVAALFAALFPDVMPSSIDPAYNLTAVNAASSTLTLQIMTGAALLFTPIVLAYQGWTYWVFRKRIGTRHLPSAQLEASHK
ncbi:cytochrome d ubiquinol oxidase subunit II [Kineosphaera limosa]|uniref:Cytochrome bd-I oxidase subunit II n=1 Tax=Kineosphaera limosa NBRC 100340 TaxID=1184609 RepID=K6XD17_9MICO|nr:cytochrome d ubiquinol oxidase subunit II [Kineosphaera limosa]NYE01552.1 cytochrome d ubiquinol oxidase subunit II [Kineosphaera limosa]GAB96709.1 cytochrome bd-I oxidase subunit II [Kineosphaera limosa NBRC 100340]